MERGPNPFRFVPCDNRELLDSILAGDRRALARAATLIENRGPGWQELAAALFPHGGRAVVAGITGPPGAGKSTFVDAAIGLLRGRGKRVAAIAVDPSSPFSGGAILGDRIRMSRHHSDEDVFIRSMASRGQTGGVASATGDLAMLLDAAGFEWVLIETVGAGQDDVDIAALASAIALVLTPGAGDSVQMMKAGIMEIAGVFLVNKCDLPGADELEREIDAALALDDSGRAKPPVIRCTATEGRGVSEALDAIAAAAAPGISRNQWRTRLSMMYRDRLISGLPAEELDARAADVAARRMDPYSVVRRWIERFPD